MSPGFPLLTNEFDDHESRKGIANVFWNQCSLVGRKVVQAKTGRAPTPDMTHFDRDFSPVEIKLSQGKMLDGVHASSSGQFAQPIHVKHLPFCGMANPQPLLEGVPIAGTPLFLPARAKNQQLAPKQSQI
ncbi:hypothetical protein [Paraburkholderia caribensis]|uniref:hypothetical protein n=1 Tax=Paraburkholderia caribensis TaxID=75105 RepID=UPI0031DEFAA8